MTRQPHPPKPETKNIVIALAINISFAIIEVVGGLYTNSIAILSDALHDFGDSIVLGMSLYFQILAGKGENAQYTFGYRRYSILGAFFNAIFLIIGSLFILNAAIPRLWHPEPPMVQGMILLAILGIIVNGFAAYRLKHGHSLNEKVLSLHLIEDVLGWVAVLIGAIVMYFYDLPIIDPILSILIACFILYNAYKSIRKAIGILVQSAPNKLPLQPIVDFILAKPGVVDLHDLHIWSLDDHFNVMSIHMVVEENLSWDEMAALKTSLYDELEVKGVHHLTIELETKKNPCPYIKDSLL